ncbi:hypothetical protein RJT34_13457 [Clitoria ternatea]|uniref:Integrase catalytic domain-containing protein n=1 Tax=Clitoria ternatea TaxID=43366 RepID=A0AAN9JNJ5_CLITE
MEVSDDSNRVKGTDLGHQNRAMEAERMKELMLLWCRMRSNRVALMGGNHTAASFTQFTHSRSHTPCFSKGSRSVRQQSMELGRGCEPKKGSKMKKHLHDASTTIPLNHETLLVIKIPDAQVLRILSRSLFLAMVLASLPFWGTVLKGFSTSTHSFVSDSGIASGSVNLELLNSVLHDLADEGLFKKGDDKTLIVSPPIGFKGIDVVIDTDFEGKSLLPDESYDFVFTPSSTDAEFIDRILKIDGIVALPLGVEPSNAAFREQSNYRVVFLRQYNDCMIVALTKTGPAITLVDSSPMRKLCQFAKDAKTMAFKSLEDVLLEPPKSKKYLKKIKYLPDLLGGSLEGYNRRLFIGVAGLPEENKGVIQWFEKNYPKKDTRFEIHSLLVPRTDVSAWLSKHVKEEEYVVMKAEAEEVEKMIKKGTICLVDELFLECKNEWWQNGNGKKKKNVRAYWECLALYGRVRDEGVAVHQCATTHTILKNEKFFYHMEKQEANANTISGSINIIEGSGRASILLPGGTKLHIESALYSKKSQRNLLSFKDIRRNGYHIETTNEGKDEYLYITKLISDKKCILEKLPSFSSGLYYTYISTVETNVIVNQKFTNKNDFVIWHERLGHPGSIMMRKIVENSNGHCLSSRQIMQTKNFSCAACSQGKLIIRPSPMKIGNESLIFLERIQGDICGPIHPSCGPFRYFMVLIDASTRWSHVCLLSTRNQAFARLLAQLIRLRAHFPDYPIKKIRLDNAGEFTSQSFNDYCMSIGIDVEHPVAHVHTQNGLAESLIKRLKLIARPLLMRSKLPISTWGHAILHAAALIRIRPTSNHEYSPLQLVHCKEPNISHLRIFGSAVYVPISPPQRTKMGPQRRLGIYVGYESPSIIKYLEPLTGDLFTARFADCHFDESIFPPLGGENKQLDKRISWNEISLSHLDPRTKQSELEVQKIISLQNLANQLPNAFADPKRVTKSYIPAVNTPIKIDIPEGQSKFANEFEAKIKRGRPVGSKDKNPRKRKVNKEDGRIEDIKTLVESPDIIKVSNPEETKVPEIDTNKEISINYVMDGIQWNRPEVDVDEIFAFKVALDIINDDKNHEPKSVKECAQRNDWPKWKDAMQEELNSLAKRKVFGPVVQTPKGVKPVGYKWVFTRKRNENGEIVRYKARLVAQGFSQRPGIDFEETYSPVMDATTFRYLISLAIREKLDLRLMD